MHTRNVVHAERGTRGMYDSEYIARKRGHHNHDALIVADAEGQLFVLSWNALDHDVQPAAVGTNLKYTHGREHFTACFVVSEHTSEFPRRRRRPAWPQTD